MSSITEAELWYGLERIGASSARIQALRAFSGIVPVMPWGSPEAAAYGVFRSNQEAAGKPLGPLDMLIASHAIAAGAVLVSNDRAFRLAKGLPGLEAWATDLP